MTPACLAVLKRRRVERAADPDWYLMIHRPAFDFVLGDAGHAGAARAAACDGGLAMTGARWHTLLAELRRRKVVPGAVRARGRSRRGEPPECGTPARAARAAPARGAAGRIAEARRIADEYLARSLSPDGRLLLEPPEDGRSAVVADRPPGVQFAYDADEPRFRALFVRTLLASGTRERAP